MEERFDRLEHLIGDLGRQLGARIDGVEAGLARLDNKIDGVEHRLRGHIEAVEEKVDDLGARVGVLHEDVKRDFRFSLEALEGLEQQIDQRFVDQARAFSAEMDPIRDAVRTALGSRGPS